MPRAWIGHYLLNPEEWFLVVARNEDEALNLLDCEWGEPDRRSLREVRNPVAINFSAKLDSEDPDLVYAVYRAHPDEVTLGEGAGYSDLPDWILKRINKPLGSPDEPELSSVGMQLGITDASILRTYLKGSPQAKPRKPGPPRKKIAGKKKAKRKKRSSPAKRTQKER